MLLEKVEQAISRLRGAGVASPEADAWHLAVFATGVSRGELQARAVRGDVMLTDDEAQVFDAGLSRRVAREPLWHITGRAPFLRFELVVGPGVFTPRPETELLTEQARTEAQLMPPRDGVVRVVDLCAGSGAIGLALAADIPHLDVLLVEKSPEAAAYLQTNRTAIAPVNTEILQGEVGQAVTHRAPGSVDVVVSNPPYLVEGADELDVETHGHDPHEALFASDGGLAVIREVVEVSAQLLRDGGVVFIEHGIDQSEAVQSLLTAQGFARAETIVDLVGRPRFTRAERARR